MSPRLVYVNDSEAAVAWVEDFKARFKVKSDALWDWANRVYDAAGVPVGDDRCIYRQSHGYITGLRWPRKMDDKLPEHWFRPVKEDHLVRPRRTGPGKSMLKVIQTLQVPDIGGELNKRFGMPEHLFAAGGLYAPGIQLQDDSVWVTWASRDIEDELAENRHYDIESHGWRKVSLVDYINRFGEEALS